MTSLHIFHPTIAHAIASRVTCPFMRLALAQVSRAGRKYYWSAELQGMWRHLMGRATSTSMDMPLFRAVASWVAKHTTMVGVEKEVSVAMSSEIVRYDPCYEFKGWSHSYPFFIEISPVQLFLEICAHYGCSCERTCHYYQEDQLINVHCLWELVRSRVHPDVVRLNINQTRSGMRPRIKKQKIL